MLDAGVAETMTMVLLTFLPPRVLDQLMDTDPDLVSYLYHLFKRG